MARLEIEKLHPDFGASVRGIDLREPLSAETLEAVREAIDEYAFLCFPDQPFDDERQLAFTRALGEPEPNHVILGREGRIEYFGTIGNVGPDGTKRGNADRETVRQSGNNLWHSDSSFRKVPTYVSIMCAYEVPDEGGETLFVSSRAAYARLPEESKERIDPLVVVHDYVYSRSKIAPDAVTPSQAAAVPPIDQKLVRKNPRTGAKNYFVGSHAKEIRGWSFEESRTLLDDLLARATRPQDVYAHKWRAADLVIWDNRCILHRGAGFDADKYRRRIRQTRVCGTGPTLEE